MEDLNNKGPLKGVRVLDMSTVIAAPYGATLLGDFGSEIIKIEKPEEGDPLRDLGPYYKNEGLRWPGMSRNKKSLTLDLRQEKGQEILKEIVKESDIIIENFRTGTLEKWNIGYEDLKEVNPDIIMIRVTGYGQTGPNAYKAGFGTPATAFSGFTYLHGYPDRSPMSPSFSLTDYITGVYVAFAAVSALYHRDHQDNGTGQFVDIGLYESLIRMMEFLITDYDQSGTIKERSPGLSGHSAPAGVFKTKDENWVVIVTSSDRTFYRLTKAMGREDLLKNDKFHTNSARLKNFGETNGIVEDWVKSLTKKELQKRLDDYGVPVSPVNSIKDIFEDEHFKERKNIVEVNHPRLGKVKIPGVVPTFSETPGSIRNVAPELGENNDNILKQLAGLEDNDIDELKKEGII